MFLEFLHRFSKERDSVKFGKLPHVILYATHTNLKTYAEKLRTSLEKEYIPLDLQRLCIQLEAQADPVLERDFPVVLLSLRHLNRVHSVQSVLLYELFDGMSLDRLPTWVIFEVALDILSLSISDRQKLMEYRQTIDFISEPITYINRDGGVDALTLRLDLGGHGSLVQTVLHGRDSFRSSELLASGLAPVMSKAIGEVV